MSTTRAKAMDMADVVVFGRVASVRMEGRWQIADIAPLKRIRDESPAQIE